MQAANFCRSHGRRSVTVICLITFVAVVFGKGSCPKSQENTDSSTIRSSESLPPGALSRLGTTRFRHTGTYSIAFTPDSRSLLLGGLYGPVVTLDTKSGLVHLRLTEEPGAWAFDVAASPDGRWLATADKTVIRLWDAKTGRQVRKLEGHTEYVICLAFGPKGMTLASGAHDGSLRMWDTATGKLLRQRNVSNDRFSATAFSPDGSLLAVSTDETVQLLSTSDLTSRWRSHVGYSSNRNIAFSPTGGFFAFGHSDGMVRLWESPSGRELRRMLGLRGDIESVDIAPDGLRVAACDESGELRVWETATGRTMLLTKAAHARCVRFSPDNKSLVVSGKEWAIRLWDLATGKEVIPQPGHVGTICAATFSLDDHLVATGGGDGAIYIWEPRSGRLVSALQGHKDGINSVVLSPDSKFIVTTGDDGDVRWWKVANGQGLWCCSLKEKRVWSVALSPDGQRIAVGTEGGSVCLLDARDGRVLHRESLGTRSVQMVAFTDSGERLVAHCGDTIFVLNGLSLSNLVNAIQVIPTIHWAGLSSSGKRVAVLDNGGRIRIHWLDTGTEIRRFPEDRREIASAAFSHNDWLLATAGWDGIVRLWEVTTGKEVSKFTGHKGKVRCVAFSSDDHLLVSGGEDTTAIVWNIGDLLGERHRSTKNIGKEELRTMWDSLQGDDAAAAFRSVFKLAAIGKDAVIFLRQHLSATALKAAEVRLLLDELGDKQFEVREKAWQKLKSIPYLEEGPLKKVLESSSDPEVKRKVRQLIDIIRTRVPDREALRWYRALRILEYADVPEARQLLEELAKGDSFDRRTGEAQQAVQRISIRTLTK